MREMHGWGTLERETGLRSARCSRGRRLLSHACHLGVNEVVSDSAAHVAVADEEDVGVEGLQN